MRHNQPFERGFTIVTLFVAKHQIDNAHNRALTDDRLMVAELLVALPEDLGVLGHFLACFGLQLDRCENNRR